MKQSKKLIYSISLICLILAESSSVFDESPDGLMEELQNYAFTPGDVSTYPTLYNQNMCFGCIAKLTKIKSAFEVKYLSLINPHRARI